MPGRTRVYVDLVGDLFHAGHVELLRQARALGDRLVVGVLSDDVVAQYKRRPITTLEERVAVVRACRYVDEVVPDAPDVVTMEFVRDHDRGWSCTETTSLTRRSPRCTRRWQPPGCCGWYPARPRSPPRSSSAASSTGIHDRE